ncbi:uncharacterized protein LOC125044624 [Penaeus chinensis]|uniref:uncharacterized protein LOC125044624 n=1 Tax=Penaeus chinensis TaxID=139456 RepID=UPI001FB6114B|nr:uncharacterized protein LOC125044624 [Penaeus chinensis]
MNALKLVCAFAAVAVCRAGVTHSSVLSPHVALPHSLPYDPVGVQQVPVAAVSHHAPLVAVKHHGSPLLHVAPSVHKTSVVHHAAPVSHSAYGAVSHSVPVVASHGVVGVSRSAPVAVAHAAHGVAHGAVAVSSPVGVAHAAPVAVAHSAPVTVSHAAPVAVSHPAHLAVQTPVKSQYHAQDELGQYSFGYNAGDSARQESRDAYGNVRGSFSYVGPLRQRPVAALRRRRLRLPRVGHQPPPPQALLRHLPRFHWPPGHLGPCGSCGPRRPCRRFPGSCSSCCPCRSPRRYHLPRRGSCSSLGPRRGSRGPLRRLRLLFPPQRLLLRLPHRPLRQHLQELHPCTEPRRRLLRRKQRVLWRLLSLVGCVGFVRM